MWRIAILSLVWACTPSGTFAWWETVVDTVETRYPDGQLKEMYETVFWGGNESTSKTGFYRSWYENGQLEWDGQYFRDKKVNTWIRWDSTGRRVEEIHYVEGEKHGTSIEWNPNGTIRKELQFYNDSLHGLCTWRKSNYTINGIYNNPGLELDIQSFYVHGDLMVPIIKESDAEWKKYSCRDKESPHYNTKHDLWIEWTTRSCEFYIGRKVDDRKEGAWTLWTRSGDIKKIDYYDNGELINPK